MLEKQVKKTAGLWGIFSQASLQTECPLKVKSRVKQSEPRANPLCHQAFNQPQARP